MSNLSRVLDPRSGTPRDEIVEALLVHKHAFYGVALFSAVINLLYLVPAIYMMQVYDRVLASRNETTLIVLTLLAIGLYALMGLIENFRASVLIRVGNAVDQILSKRVFTATFERNLKQTDGNSAQALKDLTEIRQFFTGNGLFAFLDAPWLPIYLFVLFLFHPVLGYFSTVGALLLVILAVISDRLSRKPLLEANFANIASSEYVTSNLRNYEAIEAMGMLNNLMKRWYSLQARMLERQSYASDRASVAVAATKTIRLTLQSGVLGIGAILVIEGKISPGIMIAASILMGRAVAPVELLIATWRNFTTAKSSYLRLKGLLENFPARLPNLSLPKPKGSLSAENVYVTPPSGQLSVLKGINFSISPGETVGIIGPSASGKSSLARAMVGIWQCQIGKMRLDGADIFLWPKDEVGPNIGYLPQDVELFEGTIAENICRFGEINSERIVEAAVLCDVHDMILRLPRGYETQIGEAGSALSGGQRQRIALARAAYGLPALIVLDEPNSNLDDQGENALIGAVSQLKEQRCTVVVITHRSSILRIVDKLMLIVDGRAAAFGARDEVLQVISQNSKASLPGNPKE
jgi:ATP-binding cassette subfamily C exporter for protease/lipase